MAGVAMHLNPDGGRVRASGSRVYRVWVLTLLVAILVSACDQGREPPPCDCPNLEDAVDAINWAPGLDRESIESGRDPDNPVVTQVWSAAGVDPGSQLERITEALTGAGFSITDADSGTVAQNGRLTVGVGTNQADPLELWVRATWSGDDSPAVADLLEPLRLQLADD